MVCQRMVDKYPQRPFERQGDIYPTNDNISPPQITMYRSLPNIFRMAEMGLRNSFSQIELIMKKVILFFKQLYALVKSAQMNEAKASCLGVIIYAIVMIFILAFAVWFALKVFQCLGIL